MWDVNDNQQVVFTEYFYSPQQLDIFTMNLTNISGMMVVSTATTKNVLIDHSGTVLSCSDHTIRSLANMNTRTLKISGLIG